MGQLRGGKRIGPLETFNWGKYNRMKVEDIIRKDPLYFMSAVKDWLDVSPSQANLFSELYNGDIPERYIKGVEISSETSPSRVDEILYESNKDILPNWDFYPEDKPDWVKKYEKELERIRREEGLDHIPISRRLQLYDRFQREDWRNEGVLQY